MTETDEWNQEAGNWMTSDDGRAMDLAGRRRIAEFLHAAMGWKAMTTPKLMSTGRVSKTSVDRVKRAEIVSDTTLRALGDALDTPRDFLLYIGYAETDRIERLTETEDADADLRDLIRWTMEHLFRDTDNTPPQACTA